MEPYPPAKTVLESLGYSLNEEGSGKVMGPEDEVVLRPGEPLVLFCCDCHLAHHVTAEVRWEDTADGEVPVVVLSFARMDDVTHRMRCELGTEAGVELGVSI